jgi:hypothetical protein
VRGQDSIAGLFGASTRAQLEHVHRRSDNPALSIEGYLPKPGSSVFCFVRVAPGHAHRVVTALSGRTGGAQRQRPRLLVCQPTPGPLGSTAESGCGALEGLGPVLYPSTPFFSVFVCAISHGALTAVSDARRFPFVCLNITAVTSSYDGAPFGVVQLPRC